MHQRANDQHPHGKSPKVNKQSKSPRYYGVSLQHRVINHLKT
jgi:hypothetical protein